MRLFLLPISTRRYLIYCERSVQVIPTAQKSYVDRITDKANTTWAGWEKADGGWKAKVTEYGNMMFKRIPFEEWGLKSIPPLAAREKEQAIAKQASASPAAKAREEPVEVKYPGLFQGLASDESVRDVLKRIATERQDLHRKRMWYSLFGMPLVTPFALVPVVPNIPFFYLTFRAWSHWRALRGSQHLEHLVNSNLIKLSPSTTLDQLYAAGLLHSTREASRASPHPPQQQVKSVAAEIKKKLNEGNKEVLVLQRWNAKLVAESFKLPAMEVEIERAVEQVQKAIEETNKGKDEKSGEESKVPQSAPAEVNVKSKQ